jgi:NAD(P)-dependent dehydrogenase (short-subunit alcohol dehydrogenase family)
MVRKTVNLYGRLDCAVNNAGIGGEMASIVECPFEEWQRVINVDLTGVWLCMKFEIKQMLKQEQGVIVNMSSVSGLIGTPGMSAYTAAKHGVLGLTKTAALEYATNNIRVNAVCPGAVQTTMVEDVMAKHPEMERFFLESHPIGRLGDPQEIAEVVVWLCSESSSFITGSALTADGGLTAR